MELAASLKVNTLFLTVLPSSYVTVGLLLFFNLPGGWETISRRLKV